jgi:uncharacterized protein
MSYPADQIAAQVQVQSSQAEAAIELLDSGNTIPFIARYRKEVTGSLDEEQLRGISEQLQRLRALDERRETVLNTIREQGKLTAELEAQIHAASTLTALEDLYQPYKPKRRTRASVARERGLQPLADMILNQNLALQSLAELAMPYLTEEVPTVEEAWAGARDIVAETISDHADVRRVTRQKALAHGSIISEKIEKSEDSRKVYELYYDFEARIERLRPHQVMAINRGENDKVLRVRMVMLEQDWQRAIRAVFPVDRRSLFAGQLELAQQDAAERLLLPAIERDVRRELTEKAESHAIQVFAANLRALLSQPPLEGQVILGIDPGYRTGCKLAVIDGTGKLMATGTVYLFDSGDRRQQTLQNLEKLVRLHAVTLVVIGNGTASRETEQMVAELIHRLAEAKIKLRYMIVNEAGASVYSASPLARSELPELDVSLRGAVSIARRVQDPLAELVKIEPKAIGVGLYQHDVNQKQLEETLTGVVESVVNQVGVDLNTASPALLTYVSGVGPKLAEQIVDYRNDNGPFADRQSLLRVPKLGPKAFEQAAGFLRIRGGDQPLDASAIHPESYPAAQAVLQKAGVDPHTPVAARQKPLELLTKRQSLAELASELNIGQPTLKDIFEQLVRPGRDPRKDLPAPVLRSDILKMEDLGPGMRLKGTVRNAVDFGVFVDIGVKQNGLLHRSQMPRQLELKVGDVIEVEIVSVDSERGRIGLKYATK